MLGDQVTEACGRVVANMGEIAETLEADDLLAGTQAALRNLRDLLLEIVLAGVPLVSKGKQGCAELHALSFLCLRLHVGSFQMVALPRVTQVSIGI